MAASDKRVYRVAILAFNGTDILDFAGPLEMLSGTIYNTDIEHPEPVFKATVVARYTFSPPPLVESPSRIVQKSRWNVPCSPSQFE